MKTKIFCDIAELNQIKKFCNKKIVKGFTTNPSLMRKARAKDYKKYSKSILKICSTKPVSLEVFAGSEGQKSSTDSEFTLEDFFLFFLFFRFHYRWVRSNQTAFANHRLNT